ncbi:MAG: hypothetical protein K9J17_03845 [Flavobacteriales bacterium]|nr:hypothetical protein [Flavobacteriales bacterium]
MTQKGKLTPVVLATAVRENMNANGTLKAQFKNHFLAKFSEEELNGMKEGIEGEIQGRKMAVVDEKIKFLEELGYKISK